MGIGAPICSRKMRERRRQPRSRASHTSHRRIKTCLPIKLLVIMVSTDVFAPLVASFDTERTQNLINEIKRKERRNIKRNVEKTNDFHSHMNT